MFKTINNKKKKEFKEIKFNHLMSIYELNYHNLKQVLNFRSQKNFQRSKINKNLIIDDVYQDKFTRIFKMYHKFSYDEQLQTNTTFYYLLMILLQGVGHLHTCRKLDAV